MLDLNKEAEEYAHNYFNMHETNNYKALKQGFIVGAESKYVEIQKLKYAIEQLYRFKQATFGKGVNVIKELEEQLKQLEQ